MAGAALVPFLVQRVAQRRGQLRQRPGGVLLPVRAVRGQQGHARLLQSRDGLPAGVQVVLFGLEQREFLVPVAAPAALLRLVPGQRPQETVLRAGHVLDLGELRELFEVHAPGGGPAERGVIELLRTAQPLAGTALEAQGPRGLLLLYLVHPDQRQFGGLEGVFGGHALPLVVLDQGQEPRPGVPADQIRAHVRLDLPPGVALRLGGGVGDLRGLGAPPALERAVGAVRAGADADRVLDAHGLYGVDQVGVGLGVRLAGVALVASDRVRVEQDGGEARLVGVDRGGLGRLGGGGLGDCGHVWPPCAGLTDFQRCREGATLSTCSIILHFDSGATELLDTASPVEVQVRTPCGAAPHVRSRRIRRGFRPGGEGWRPPARCRAGRSRRICGRYRP
ncbi:hypothetical protein STENM36S_04595 [Streptomyces tendae]